MVVGDLQNLLINDQHFLPLPDPWSTHIYLEELISISSFSLNITYIPGMYKFYGSKRNLEFIQIKKQIHVKFIISRFNR